MHRQSTYYNQRENQDQANNNGSLVAGNGSEKRRHLQELDFNLTDEF